MMMRKTSLILLGAAAGIAVTLIATPPPPVPHGARAQGVAGTDRRRRLFGDVLELVRANYVEKPDDSKLMESAIDGMVAGVDPHSSYMDSKSFRDLEVQARGEFGGRGIEVSMADGLIKV